MWTSISICCQLIMCNTFANFLHFGGLFPCFCEFSWPSFVSMLQEEEPGRKGGNSDILNQGGETKILSCFLLVAKMLSENEKQALSEIAPPDNKILYPKQYILVTLS